MREETQKVLYEKFFSLADYAACNLPEEERTNPAPFCERLVARLDSIISEKKCPSNLLLFRFQANKDTKIDVTIDLPKLSFFGAIGTLDSNSLEESGVLNVEILNNSSLLTFFTYSLFLEEEELIGGVKLVEEGFSEGCFEVLGFYSPAKSAQFRMISKSVKPWHTYIKNIMWCLALKNGIRKSKESSCVPQNIYLNQSVNAFFESYNSPSFSFLFNILPVFSCGGGAHFAVCREFSFRYGNDFLKKWNNPKITVEKIKHESITGLKLEENRRDGVGLYNYIIGCKDLTLLKVCRKIYMELIKNNILSMHGV